MAGIDPRFYWLTLGLLALCVLVGLVVAYRFQREINNDLTPPTDRDLLGPLEQAYYSGLMREEEFQRIQEAMVRQRGEDLLLTSKASKLRSKPADKEGSPADEGKAVEDPESPITPTGDSAPDREPG